VPLGSGGATNPRRCFRMFDRGDPPKFRRARSTTRSLADARSGDGRGTSCRQRRRTDRALPPALGPWMDTASWRALGPTHVLLPRQKMKMRRPHRVPLASQALAMLRELQKITGGSGYLFPSMRSWHRPISDSTLNAALRVSGTARSNCHSWPAIHHVNAPERKRQVTSACDRTSNCASGGE